MRIAVFGAAGFLGAWAVRALLADGHEVHAVVRPTTDVWRISAVPGLVLEKRPNSEWPTVIASGGFDAVVSLDWEGVSAGSRDDAIQWKNLDRQRSMIIAAADAGVRRFVGLGSQAEYGPRRDRSDEESPTRPITAYGRAKVAALDQLRALSEQRGLEWVWARVFSVYGPLDNPGTLLASMAAKFRAGEEMELSSGQQLWSYLYATDAGAALSRLATDPRASGVVNVGHPLAPPLRELIEEFAGNFPGGGRLAFAAPVDAASVSNLAPSTSRLTALDWKVTVPTALGLATAARWLRGETLDDPYFPEGSIPKPPAADR